MPAVIITNKATVVTVNFEQELGKLSLTDDAAVSPQQNGVASEQSTVDAVENFSANAFEADGASAHSDEESVGDNDFYLHIDLKTVGGAIRADTGLAGRRINRYMLLNDAFDPRRAQDFPSDRLDEDEVGNLTARRQLDEIGQSYYELWKVRHTFSFEDFDNAVVQAQDFPLNVEVKVLAIRDGEHENLKFTKKAA
ncbi:hypothetical protein MIR68_010642 [Amoeboaphelidium protococcarum]|nr:hypothetical protein MIR68_010642 [Amoeboaphelidium protococcarum]